MFNLGHLICSCLLYTSDKSFYLLYADSRLTMSMLIFNGDSKEGTKLVLYSMQYSCYNIAYMYITACLHSLRPTPTTQQQYGTGLISPLDAAVI